MIYISFVSLESKMTIYWTRKATIALLLAKEVILLAEYLDFADVFSVKSAEIL